MRRTKEDAEKTRQTVLEAALKLFSRDGYSLTTLSRIAKEAGCSRGPIYWHFENKDDLYEAVLAYSQEPLEALVAECSGMRETPIEAMDHFIERWLSLLATSQGSRPERNVLHRSRVSTRSWPTRGESASLQKNAASAWSFRIMRSLVT